MTAARPEPAAREDLFAPGMRDHDPGFCWRLLPGDRCCILHRGHDDGKHERSSGLTDPAATTADAETANLLRLASQPTLSPRPWELIFNRGPVKHFDGTPAPGSAPISNSFRIVDAENRLLVRIQADPEQTLKAEDMQLIVAAVNALARLAASAERAEEAERARDTLANCDCVYAPVSSFSCPKCGRRATIPAEQWIEIVKAANQAAASAQAKHDPDGCPGCEVCELAVELIEERAAHAASAERADTLAEELLPLTNEVLRLTEEPGNDLPDAVFNLAAAVHRALTLAALAGEPER